jgi:hypothetical protein
MIHCDAESNRESVTSSAEHAQGHGDQQEGADQEQGVDEFEHGRPFGVGRR